MMRLEDLEMMMRMPSDAPLRFNSTVGTLRDLVRRHGGVVPAPVKEPVEETRIEYDDVREVSS